MHSKSWFHLIVFPDILDFLNIYVFSTKKIILFFYILGYFTELFLLFLLT